MNSWLSIGVRERKWKKSHEITGGSIMTNKKLITEEEIMKASMPDGEYCGVNVTEEEIMSQSTIESVYKEVSNVDKYQQIKAHLKTCLHEVGLCQEIIDDRHTDIEKELAKIAYTLSSTREFLDNKIGMEYGGRPI